MCYIFRMGTVVITTMVQILVCTFFIHITYLCLYVCSSITSSSLTLVQEGTWWHAILQNIAQLFNRSWWLNHFPCVLLSFYLSLSSSLFFLPLLQSQCLTHTRSSALSRKKSSVTLPWELSHLERESSLLMNPQVRSNSVKYHSICQLCTFLRNAFGNSLHQ